jgi:hypothetical protein
MHPEQIREILKEQDQDLMEMAKLIKYFSRLLDDQRSMWLNIQLDKMQERIGSREPRICAMEG